MKAACYIVEGRASPNQCWQPMHSMWDGRGLLLGRGTVFRDYERARKAVRRSQRVDKTNPTWANWEYRIVPLYAERANR